MEATTSADGPTAGSPAVQVRNITKTFGVTRALSDVSLQVAKGSSVALLGRNGAGKSTLISIITGLQTADSGTIEFGMNRHDGHGVGCVYQKSTLVGGLTAAENISLNRYPRSPLRTVDWKEVRRLGRERLAEWNCEHVGDTLVEELDPVDRKIVEISRVLSLNPDVLLLDEPTAGLDFAGAQRLFAHIDAARGRGVSIIYVSHHLEEIFEVCERTTVLRDGRVVLDRSLQGLDVHDLVDAMVGDAASTAAVEQPPTILDDEAMLSVTALSSAGRFEEVSFDVRPGECLGIAGLEGSGHVQIAEALCGLRRSEGGRLTLRGVPLKGDDVRSRISAGIGHVPEDRHNGGYVPALSAAENVTLPVMRRVANRFRMLNARLRDDVYGKLADEWAIKAWGPGQPVEELSGGNQQKVVLARAVASDPSILVLMNPTAGVDVAAKRSIYATVKKQASQGKGVLVVSADDEDFTICHRVIVMFRGKVHGVLHAPFSDAELAKAIQGK